MPIEYPSNIPSCIEKGSLAASPVDSVLETSIEGDNLETRNRHEIELYNTSFRIRMNNQERIIFLDWYHNTLKKVLGFNFTDPVSNVVRVYHFITPPTSSHIGGNHFLISFSLETS